MIEKIDKLITNFQLRNIEVICFDTLECAKNEILNLVPINVSVGIGHSATLQKMDITKTLKCRGNSVFDKEMAKDKEECNSLSIIEGQSVKGRIKVFIVNEDLGY